MNSIIKMKKHPVDELFAKKLAEYRQEPSQKAFEKFQARLQEKQQKPKGGFFWVNRNWTYYAAAAGVAIALSIGFLSQIGSPDVQTLASVQSTTTVELPKTVEPQTMTPTLSKADGAKVQTNNSHKTSRKLIERVLAEEKSGLVATTAANPKIDDSPEELMSLTTTQPIFDETHTAIAAAQPTEDPKNQGVFKTDVGESVVVILEPTMAANEVIPAINEDSATSAEEVERLNQEKDEKEKSFIAKLYGEYKHFKYGEKVDLQKLGVKDVMARVDNSVIKEDITDVRDFFQRRVGRLQKRD